MVMMRKFLLSFVLIVIAMLVVWQFMPETRDAVWMAGENAFHKLFWDKEVIISGDSRLADKTIRELLPLDRSTIWWAINSDLIENDLKKSAWVEKADIHTCGASYFSLWGCFVVSIEERQPAFLIYQDNILWLVGEDGHFISPLTSRLKELLVNRPLKTLKGVYEDHPSTDLFNARFFFVKEAIRLIETRTRKKIRELTLNGNSEIEVAFEDAPFIAVFSGGSEHIEDIKGECLRFMTILAQLGGKEGEIEKVDLAFSKLAVVKMKDTPIPVPIHRSSKAQTQ